MPDRIRTDLTWRLLVALAALVAATVPAGGVVAATASDGCDAPESPSPASTESPASPSPPAIRSVYPNPVAPEDRGEFVVLDLPAAGNWTLDDGDDRVRLPGNVSGRVVVTAAPDALPATVEGRVVRLAGLPRLSNAGERLALRRDGRVVDEVAYGDAPESERYRPGDGFEPLGATDFAVNSSGPTEVTAFALPDAPAVPVETLEGAQRRILLAGYTLTSERVTRALVAAAERGVRVSVLLEGGPVGGTSRRQARMLDRLVDAGVDVQVVGGAAARVRFHHPKYAVVDDRALVLSENWKPSGTGGRKSRGWGVLVTDQGTADHLAAVFRADAGWRDARPWQQVRPNTSLQAPDVANGSYPSRFDPQRMTAEAVDVLVAPDNAEGAVLRLLRSACETLLVQQVAVGGRRMPFLQAALAAARRGVEVRLLLSSAWYVREENRRLAEWLNRRADREGLDLTAKVAEPGSRYGSIHNKGVVVDGDRALVGSLNWNNNSARRNREVAVVLEGAAAGYYESVFRADWQGGRDHELPVGVLLVAVLVVVAAARWGYERIEFEAG